MKILQIVNYYYPNEGFGGPVQCTYYLSKYMVEKGHDVTVYTTDVSDSSPEARMKDKFQVINGVKVFFFPYVSKHYGFFIDPEVTSALRSTIKVFDHFRNSHAR